MISNSFSTEDFLILDFNTIILVDTGCQRVKMVNVGKTYSILKPSVKSAITRIKTEILDSNYQNLKKKKEFIKEFHEDSSLKLVSM